MQHNDISKDDVAREFKIVLRECKTDKEKFDNIANAIAGIGCMLDLIMDYLPDEMHWRLEKFIKSIEKSNLKMVK